MYKLDTPQQNEYLVLLAIWEVSVKATHQFLKEEDIEFFKMTIRENRIFEMVNLTVVRDDNNKILGFMGVSEDSLEMIFLHPDARGKGIGKMLLKYAIDDLKITKIDVNEQNTEALQFYEHFGFKVMSRSALDGTGKPYPILHMQLA
jgi:putative acetyltransferase